MPCLDQFGGYGSLTSYSCRFCPPDVMLFSSALGDLMEDWSGAFCACLGTSTDSVLQTATNCTIKRHSAGEVFATEGKQEKVKALELRTDFDIATHETSYDFDVVSDVVPSETVTNDAFIKSCWKSSYNSFFNPAEHFMKSVVIQNETIIDIGPSSATARVANHLEYVVWFQATEQ